jgi:hypothetical protein
MTERTFRTSSGSFSASDLAVLVWLNPKYRERSQKRLLETVTSKENSYPIAFPIKSLQFSLKEHALATEDNLHTIVLSSTQQNPVIIPIPLAESALGWTDFYIPSEYTEQ